MLDSSHFVRGFSVHALRRIGTIEALDAAMEHLEATRYDT
jgi:hypothetical protein